MELEGKITPLLNFTYLDKATDKVQIQRHSAVSKVPAAVGICEKSLHAPHRKYLECVSRVMLQDYREV